MYRANAYGCLVASDLDLHLAEAREDQEVRVVLQRAAGEYDTGWDADDTELIVRHRDETKGQAHLAARTPDGFRLRFEGSCEFDLNPALDRIGWRVAPEAEPDLVPILAAGALMAFRFMLAGDLVLHCSTVSVAGRGLAFVGHSGMGKSTMAALMCAAGADLVTDDVGRVLLDSDGVTVATGGRESRLRRSAHHIADRIPAATARRTGDRRLAVALSRSPADFVPLEAIVVPLPLHSDGQLTMRRLAAGEAVIALNTFHALAGVVSRDLLAVRFQRVVELVKRVPVFAGSIPWGDARSRNAATELLGALGWPQPVPAALL